MAKPVLLAIDDDTNVLEAVVQDLRRHYGQSYRIIRAASGLAALDICAQLVERKDAVALFLADQRMPGMTGVDFLQRALKLYPDAKRVLLTAYADTDAAIQAINSAKIHYYLNKPWDPPEEKLYPVLDDLLEAWKQGYQPPFEGIRVVGSRWSAQDRAVRLFLSRNRIPFKWLDSGETPDAMALLQSRGIDGAKLPVVLFSDDSSLIQPSFTQLAGKVGLRTEAEQDFYDVIIIGAGPAGLAAGVYAASEGLQTVLIEAEAPGGQAGYSSKIENYLGFPSGISGEELGKRAFLQANRLGANFLTQRVAGIRTENEYKILRMTDGREITCHACLIATGVSYRKLEIPGEVEFSGAGLYYGAAIADAMSCAKEDVYLVGGANSAGQAALHFAPHAARVHMLVRGPSLQKSMSRYLIDQIAATSNILVETGTEIKALSGDRHLEAITVVCDGVESTRSATSVFVFIGAAPRTDWLPAEILRDSRGFILSGIDIPIEGDRRDKLHRPPFMLETSVPGIFVAGDVRFNSVKRCASAVGEGSIAIQFVHQYLATL